MLRASLFFFVLALVAFVLGANNIAGLSIELGKILLMVFLALAILSFLVNLITGRKSKSLV